MFIAQFIFETSNVTEEFIALDNLIAEAAEDNKGFIGKDSWITEDGKRRNSIYYWENQASLREFSIHPKHLEAKKRYQEWYSGFHVVISEVTKSYGDNTFTHITPNSRNK